RRGDTSPPEGWSCPGRYRPAPGRSRAKNPRPSARSCGNREGASELGARLFICHKTEGKDTKTRSPDVSAVGGTEFRPALLSLSLAHCRIARSVLSITPGPLQG